jgi:8-oxo-dGTP diphosphatase
MRSTAPRYQHIAAGALVNARGEVLVCQRPPHKLYPGEWEFPGGKVEAGEHVEDALRRELREELGIEVTAARPLVRLRFSYPELSVELDTWLVTAWSGEPVSTEHPATAWVAPDALPHWPLLAADRPIVNALRLPAQCVFTPEAPDEARLELQLGALPPGALLRLRLPGATDPAYRAVAQRWCARPRAGTRLILDRDPADVVALGADGFHVRAAVLRQLRARPVPADKWFGVSCHDAGEVALARGFGADYIVLGPVKATGTHPGALPLGWPGFERLARGASLPVYAIGGLGPQDLADAWRHGAQGVAGISAYWRGLSEDGGSGRASGSGSAGIA